MQQTHKANRFFKNLMIFNIKNRILQILFRLGTFLPQIHLINNYHK
jgi:hypothetical protein